MDLQSFYLVACTLLLSTNTSSQYVTSPKLNIQRGADDIMILPGSFCGAQAMFCGYFHAAVHEDCSCRCPKERKTFYEPNWTCTRDALIHRWEGNSPFQDKNRLTVLSEKKVTIAIAESQEKCMFHGSNAKYMKCDGTWTTIQHGSFEQMLLVSRAWTRTNLTLQLKNVSGSIPKRMRLLQGRIVKLQVLCMPRKPTWVSSRTFNLLFKIPGNAKCAFRTLLPVDIKSETTRSRLVSSIPTATPFPSTLHLRESSLTPSFVEMSNTVQTATPLPSTLGLRKSSLTPSFVETSNILQTATPLPSTLHLRESFLTPSLVETSNTLQTATSLPNTLRLREGFLTPSFVETSITLQTATPLLNTLRLKKSFLTSSFVEKSNTQPTATPLPSTLHLRESFLTPSFVETSNTLQTSTLSRLSYSTSHLMTTAYGGEASQNASGFTTSPSRIGVRYTTSVSSSISVSETVTHLPVGIYISASITNRKHSKSVTAVASNLNLSLRHQVGAYSSNMYNVAERRSTELIQFMQNETMPQTSRLLSTLNTSSVRLLRASRRFSSYVSIESVLSTRQRTLRSAASAQTRSYINVVTSTWSIHTSLETSLRITSTASAENPEVVGVTTDGSKNSKAFLAAFLVPAGFLFIAYLLVLVLWCRRKLYRARKKDMVLRVASTQRYGQVLQDIDPGINGGDPPPLPPPYGRTERWSSSLRSYISDCNLFDPHCVINPIYEGGSSKERENLHPARFLSPGDPESSSMLSEFYDGNGHHVFMGPRNVTTGDLNNPYENIDITYTGTLSSGCHTESTSLRSNRAVYSEIGNIT